MDGIYSNIIFIICVVCALLVNYFLAQKNFYSHINFSGSRYFYLDGIRGIAAVCVVMNHVVFSLQNNNIQAENIDTSNFWIFYHAGNFGVQVFFCITGFLFFDKLIKSNNNFNWDRYLLARIKRLIPMYLISTFIVLILTLIWSHAGQPIITTIRQSINLFAFGFMGSDIWVNGYRTYALNAVIWTLPYEWGFYFLFPFISTSLKIKPLFSIFLFFVLMFALNDLIFSKSVWVYFLTGAITAHIKNKINQPVKINYRLISIALSIIPLIYILTILNLDFSGYGYERYLLTSLLFIFVVLTEPKVFQLKCFVYLGEASYSSYLLHLIINALVISLLSKLFNLANITMPLFYILITALVILTSLITAYTFKYIELRFIKK